MIDVDDSGFAQDMPRCWGYAVRGTPCYGKQDWQAKGRTNVIGALLSNKLMTVCTFQNTINSATFHAWVIQDLLPKAPYGAVIIMDNATFHKGKNTQVAIEQAYCELKFLPPYSPDLNPIEHQWAQEKAIRRRLRCSVDHAIQQDNL